MTDPREGEPGWVHPYMGPECGPDCHHDLKREPDERDVRAQEQRDEAIVERACALALRAVTITCPRYGSHGKSGSCGRCYDYQQAIHAAFEEGK